MTLYDPTDKLANIPDACRVTQLSILYSTAHALLDPCTAIEPLSDPQIVGSVAIELSYTTSLCSIGISTSCCVLHPSVVDHTTLYVPAAFTAMLALVSQVFHT